MRLITNYVLIFMVLLSCSSGNDLQIDTSDPATSIGDNTASNNDVNGNSETATLNILFVGNSLTYNNNLPELVYELAKAKKELISTKMVAKPNYAIIDHLDNGNEVENEIKSKKYDYVVVQQGPSSQSEGRRTVV